MSENEAGPDRYHARRQRRSAVTLVVVIAVLAGAFYYASTYFRDTEPKASTACATTIAPDPLVAADVTVTVLNSSTRKGLAGQVAAELKQRSFVIDKVANDSSTKAYKEPAQIRFGPAGEASAKLLAEHVPGAKLVKDKRKGDTVDLALGASWKKLGPVPTASSVPTLPLCPGVTPSATK